MLRGVIIAATHSGCGKTTVTAGAARRCTKHRGIAVRAAKCGLTTSIRRFTPPQCWRAECQSRQLGDAPGRSRICSGRGEIEGAELLVIEGDGSV